jgi:transcriptional regulator with XRE-family HTH domain
MIITDTYEDDAMELTQPEIIQLLRRRKGLNQAELGVQAFGLTPYSARTKIKNIELGRQIPTVEDAQKLALALDVQLSDIQPSTTPDAAAPQQSQDNCCMTAETLQLFPGFADYAQMLNNAVRIGDQDLISYIAGKLSELFALNGKGKAASHR